MNILLMTTGFTRAGANIDGIAQADAAEDTRKA